jgi:hypothetical protein
MRGSGKGTGARGVQIHPRSDKYLSEFDRIFRPSTRSNQEVDITEENEEDSDREVGLSESSL